MEGISTEKSLMEGENWGSDTSCFFYSTSLLWFLGTYHKCEMIVQIYTDWQDLAFSLSVLMKLWQNFSFYSDGIEAHKIFLIYRTEENH